jgi:hypothetical protein
VSPADIGLLTLHTIISFISHWPYVLVVLAAYLVYKNTALSFVSGIFVFLCCITKNTTDSDVFDMGAEDIKLSQRCWWESSLLGYDVVSIGKYWLFKGACYIRVQIAVKYLAQNTEPYPRRAESWNCKRFYVFNYDILSFYTVRKPLKEDTSSSCPSRTRL